jgi:gluconokinase
MVIVVMGVVGAGKTTVGRLLAQQLGWKFADGDDFHPPENVEKIRRGIPLKDVDRQPWLERLHTAITNWNSAKQNVILACSALKRAYRDKLQTGAAVEFVYLQGTAQLVAQRLRARHGHFADEQILASQFADLEEPEKAINVGIDRTPEEIVTEIRARLGLA